MAGRLGVLPPQDLGRSWSFTPISGNKMEKRGPFFFFLMGKQLSWVSPSQLTLPTLPELLTLHQGQGESPKLIAAAVFCPEATTFFSFVLSLFRLIHFQ